MGNNNLKSYFRKVVNKFQKYPIIYSNAFDLQNTLKHFKIDLVIDVGAYTGTYALSLRRFGYKKKIISFEPVKKSYEQLTINLKKDKNWSAFERMALGEKNKKTKIYISKKIDCSSILKIRKEHTNIVPNSLIKGHEFVNLKTLDSLLHKFPKYKNALLKIDTQGYEYPILLGSKKFLKHIKIIQLEISLAKLYDKQVNYEKIFNFLKKYNFAIWNIIPGLKNKKTGN